jgi:hypothetical protein
MDVIAVPQTSSAPPARSAYAQMLQRRREVKVRSSHERIQNWIRALVCGGILAALLMLGIFTGWVPLPGSSIVATNESAADRFVETRTGRMLFPMLDGVFCRQVIFNNETGVLSGDKTVHCDDFIREKSKTSRDLMHGLRGGFSKN